MKTPKELHEAAMSLYEASLAAKFNGDEPERMKLLKEAFTLEKDAATILKYRLDKEPTRSVLFASAATMAWQLNDFEECETLIKFGLAGEPPKHVSIELKSLLDKIKKQP